MFLFTERAPFGASGSFFCLFLFFFSGCDPSALAVLGLVLGRPSAQVCPPTWGPMHAMQSALFGCVACESAPAAASEVACADPAAPGAAFECFNEALDLDLAGLAFGATP